MNLNLPYRVPLQVVVEVFREEGLALKWISRPGARRTSTTIKSQTNKVRRMKAHQESLS